MSSTTHSIEIPTSPKSAAQQDGCYLLKQHMLVKVQAVKVDICAYLYANIGMAINFIKKYSHYFCEKYMY